MNELLKTFTFNSQNYEAEIEYDASGEWGLKDLQRQYGSYNGQPLWGHIHPDDTEWDEVVDHIGPLVQQWIEEATP